MAGYQSLEMWQKAHQWVIGVYKVTRAFPREELYALGDQLRRSASAVPINMSEGYRRFGDRDKLRFYNYAQTSLDEADYELLLAHDLGYADMAELRERSDEIARMLNAYIRKLRGLD